MLLCFGARAARRHSARICANWARLAEFGARREGNSVWLHVTIKVWPRWPSLAGAAQGSMGRALSLADRMRCSSGGRSKPCLGQKPSFLVSSLFVFLSARFFCRDINKTISLQRKKTEQELSQHSTFLRKTKSRALTVALCPKKKPTHKPLMSQWAAIVLALTLRPTSGTQTSSRDFANKLPSFHVMEGIDLGIRGHRSCFVVHFAPLVWLLLSLSILGHSGLYKASDSGPQAQGSDFVASSTPRF